MLLNTTAQLFSSLQPSILTQRRVFDVWILEQDYRSVESIERRMHKNTGHYSPVCSIIFYPNGKYLASGSSNKTIGLWRVSSGKLIKTFIGHSSHVCSVIFSPDGKYLASGSADKTIGLWKVSSREPIKTLTGHFDYVRSVVFSSDGEYLESRSSDNTIRLWRV